MRPHRLRVTAFGPFPATVEVDLDEVSAAGPFLLRGATGAGKTSLLDAVGYALFGRVPGSRGLKQLRSDHAADNVRTSVELWATVGDRAVHVVRTPDQRRRKARGTGTTPDKASVSVRVAPDMQALEADECTARWSGVQEANDELARLVGMTHEQFVQVVLLPQGDFARFLRARDEERADVLRALFDTGRFRAVEQHLRERRDAARDALAHAGTQAASAAARVAALSDAGDPPASGLAGWAGTLLEEAARSAAAAVERADRASAAVASLRSAHEASLTLHRLLTELVPLTRARGELLRSAPDVEAVAAELAAAERAAGVLALHEMHEQARRRAAGSHREAVAALAATEQDVTDPGGESAVLTIPDGADGADVADRADGADAVDGAALQALVELVAARATTAVDRLARLEAARRDVRRWEEAEQALLGHRAALAEAETALLGVQRDVAALPARAAALSTRLDDERAQAAELAAAVHDVERWDHLVAAAVELAEQSSLATAAEAADLAARAVARADQESYDRLRRARLAGMSAELAAGLLPGEPCTVCGATEHPAPAVAQGEPVDADTEDGARERAVRSAAAAVRSGIALARAVARRDASHARLRVDAAPDVDVPEQDLLEASQPGRSPFDAVQGLLAARASLARGRLAQARAAAQRAVVTAAELDRVRAEQAEGGEHLGRAGHRVAGCRAAVDCSLADAAGLLGHLRDVLGEGVDGGRPAAVLRELLSDTGHRVERARCAADALRVLVAARSEAGRARVAARTAAVQAGWPDVEHAVAAARPRRWCEAARDDVARHGRELHAAVAGVQARRDDLAAAGVVLPDGIGDALVADVLRRTATVASEERRLAAGVADAEVACREADGERARLAGVLDGLGRAVPQLVAADRAPGPLREQAEAARALADLCTGTNDKGVPLSTYVLAAHLEDVVEAANLRLDGMSDGRYALVHVEEGEDRRRRAGLGLAVLDAWTGRQRPAGTLSGGETFLASLALALGLADVVTAEAGGARIDALFVDEGFGTLDPDSLDRAMDVLDQLQEHGRMVGVVSHVGELRQRLPRQVHVEAGRNGSTVRVAVG